MTTAATTTTTKTTQSIVFCKSGTISTQQQETPQQSPEFDPSSLHLLRQDALRRSEHHAAVSEENPEGILAFRHVHLIYVALLNCYSNLGDDPIHLVHIIFQGQSSPN